MAQRTALPQALTAHPASEGETYGEHFRVAMAFSVHLAKASMCAAMHAVLPEVHKTSASQAIRRLNDCLESGNRDAICIQTRRSRRQAPDSLRTANSA